MRNFKRVVVSFIAALSLFMMNPVSAHAEWKSNTTGWWYTEGSSWATGWRVIDGNWYYFYSDGYMAHDCWIGDYYVNSSGAWTTDVPTSSSANSNTSTGAVSSGTTQSYVTNGAYDTVYVSKNGIYHSSPTAHGMKYYTAMSRQQAIENGYRACETNQC